VGKIVTVWLGEKGLCAAFEEIEFQIATLRQEIQDLKGKKPIPEPELQRGDFVSYISDGSPAGRKEGDKVWGTFHHQDACDVWAHFQQIGGGFTKSLGLMPKERVTFEFRPEK